MTENRELPVQWADRAQFHAEDFEDVGNDGVEPKVSLLWMTPDPLGNLAAYCEMYKGNVIRGPKDITDEMRAQALEDVQATHLQAPLENIKVGILIEGVDRAFTHQLVRQRTAVFAQESMRFAVLGDLLDATTLPPSLQGTERTEQSRDTEFDSGPQQQRWMWDEAVRQIDAAYHALVNSGMPAEEARGLLPHATATRIHFTTDLRNLIAHAGNRLCTQAQFHWRSVFTQIVDEIRNHWDGEVASEKWQYEAIADSGMFKPVCFQLGKCPFKASFDRACSIRSRVDRLSAQGHPPENWDQEGYGPDRIFASDWQLDVNAARVKGPISS